MVKPNPRTGKVPTGAVLTKHLRALAAEASEQIADDGSVLTRAEALALLIWGRALGWVEKGDKGEQVNHKPEPWAISLIYERLEGRCPTAMDTGNKGTVADKVSEMGVAAINDLTPEAGGE